ncbi:MAG: HpcH/HpaI aldolase/citrate lyase family protein [Cytophagales bacterium]|nr:HpcH/HpaI aldolase/citrate lyase family protein [Cytophagales bacterium]
MQNPTNHFKRAIQNKQLQIGLWQSLIGGLSGELCASAGFDWLLLDAEHSPNDLQSLMQQLQIIAAYPQSNAIVRIPNGYGDAGAAIIKQHLDLGVQSLLVPMIDTAEQAQHVVRATRYPPQGIRGVAGGRASRWGRIVDYSKVANDQICVLVQAESMTAINNLEAICAIEGIDGVFIGPADLSASMGYIGQLQHPEVLRVIDEAINRINKAGKASGILTADERLAQHYIDIGTTFVAVGLDNNILMRGTKALVEKFKKTTSTDAGSSGY